MRRRTLLLALLCLIPALVLCQQGSIRYTRKSTVTVVSCGTLCDDLVAYWNLDEASGERSDSVGTADLTDNNTVEDGTGIHNAAALFVAVNDEYLSHADIASLQLAGDSAISVWVKPSGHATVQMIVTKDDDIVRGYTLYYEAAQTLQWVVKPAAGVEALSSTDTLTDGAWNHIVAEVDGSTAYLTINGGTRKSLVLSGPVIASTAEFQIGHEAYPGFGLPFDGLIDEPAIWSRALIADERTELWNSGSGKFYDGSIFALYFRAEPWRYAHADWLYYLPQRPPLGLAALKLRSN